MPAPTFYHGVARSGKEVIGSYATAKFSEIVTQLLEDIPQISAFQLFIIILSIVGIVDILVLMEKSKFWNTEYSIGYLVGIIFFTAVFLNIEGYFEWTLLVGALFVAIWLIRRFTSQPPYYMR